MHPLLALFANGYTTLPLHTQLYSVGPQIRYTLRANQLQPDLVMPSVQTASQRIVLFSYAFVTETLCCSELKKMTQKLTP